MGAKALAPEKRTLTDPEKAKNERKKNVKHRILNRNKENENQGLTLEQRNTGTQENRAQKALTESTSLNTG
ncbi:9389_t:CDS:2 [Gigaspora rosea]|nr:9389_t:CDS:2 [Gigaspora rosea]